MNSKINEVIKNDVKETKNIDKSNFHFYKSINKSITVNDVKNI